jgi:hypothetical protein
MTGESVIFDDEGNTRTVDTWAASEIIRLRKETARLRDELAAATSDLHLIKAMLAENQLLRVTNQLLVDDLTALKKARSE